MTWADELFDEFRVIRSHLKEILMSQAELNTDVANLLAANTALTASVSDIATQLATILTEIQALQAQVAAGGTVDLSGLETQIAATQVAATAAASADTSAQADAAAGAQGAQGTVADPTAGTPQTSEPS